MLLTPLYRHGFVCLKSEVITLKMLLIFHSDPWLVRAQLRKDEIPAFRKECESKVEILLTDGYQSWTNFYPPQQVHAARQEFGPMFCDTDDVMVILNHQTVVIAGVIHKVKLKADAVDGIFSSMRSRQSSR